MSDTSFQFTYPLSHNGAVIAEIGGVCEIEAVGKTIVTDINLARVDSDLTVRATDALAARIEAWLYKAHGDDITRCAAAYEAGRLVYDREKVRELRAGE